MTDDSFDRETYLRLYEHVNSAIASFMENWTTERSHMFSRTHSSHELEAEMVRLRHLMEARLALATHSGWPAGIRDALVEALRIDLATVQHDLEDVAGRSSAGGTFDRTQSDELVALIRRNPLTSLLPADTCAPTAGEPTVDRQTVSPSGRPVRRILF